MEDSVPGVCALRPALFRQRLPDSAGAGVEYYAKIYLETPALFAWTLVVIALSLGLEGAMGALLRRLEGP